MLELLDIRAGYAGTEVLHDVSLDVPTGSVVCLLGPNGAGKTTLLRVASRELGVRAGHLKLAGKDVTKLSAHDLAKAGVCYVPEGRGVFPALSVRDNLLLFSRGRSVKSAIAKAVDAFPFLESRMDALASQLSGGERQMLALVRAWLVDPKVVLLDEVSMGLAPLVVDEVYRFIYRLAGEGISLLIVEQYIGRVQRFADQAYLLRNGRVSFSGAPDQLGSEEEILGHYLGAAISN
jgi:branched-chain amino acid transport system ATP-binding protein